MRLMGKLLGVLLALSCGANAAAVDRYPGIALDRTHVYWTDSRGTIGRMPKAGGDRVTLHEGGAPHAIAVDETHVFWTDIQGGIQRLDKGGGSLLQLTWVANAPIAIALDDSHVYWA